MFLENIVQKGELLDCYGALLTVRQRECLELYYNENLTLAEIAEYFHISRQAVHDAMRHGEEQLENYEAALHVAAARLKRKKAAEEISLLLSDTARETFRKNSAASSLSFSESARTLRRTSNPASIIFEPSMYSRRVFRLPSSDSTACFTAEFSSPGLRHASAVRLIPRSPKKLIMSSGSFIFVMLSPKSSFSSHFPKRRYLRFLRLQTIALSP